MILSAAFWLLAMPTSLADAPTRSAAVLSAGSGSIERLQLSTDGGAITGVNGAGTAFLLDLESWEITPLQSDECTAASAAAASDGNGGYTVFVGCTDASISLWDYDGSDAVERVDDDGSPAFYDLASTEIGETDTVEGVFILDNEGTLLAVTAGGGSGLVSGNYASVLDPATGVLLGGAGALATPLGSGTYNDGVIVGDTVVGVHRGSGEISQITVSGTTATSVEFGSLLGGGVAGLRPDGSDLSVDLNGTYYVPDNNTDALYSLNNSTSWFLALSVTAPIVSAIDPVEDWVVVGRSSGIEVYESLAGGSDQVAIDQITTGRPADALTDGQGYAFIGTDEGTLEVLTANPWVSDIALDPSSGLDGTAVTMSFLADTTGSFTVRVGGSRAGTDGTVVYTGEVDEAGVTNELSFDVDDSFVEGSNDVFVVLTDASGRRGVQRAIFELANPPGDIVLTEANVAFGNGRIALDFGTLSTDDVASFDVYFSDEPFVGSDFATAGPTFTETVDEEQATSPLSVDNTPGPTGALTAGIEPVVNGKTYYVAVRTVDSTGLESEMSNVIEVTPRETFLAADLANEPGGPPAGCSCGAAQAQGPAGFGLGLGLLGLLGLRRRRHAAALVLGAALVASVVPATAHAQNGSAGLNRFTPDLTPAWGNLELTYSRFQFADPNLDVVYNNSANMVRLEAGPQLFRFAEIDLGVGFLWKKGFATDAADASSGDAGRMVWVPFNLDFTARIHIIDEQPVVPFLRVGADYVFWRETELDADGNPNQVKRTTGSKAGWHWGAGGQILLDFLAPARASRLEASSGINDTWLTIGYRQQVVGRNSTGLEFSGWELQAGLKIDY